MIKREIEREKSARETKQTIFGGVRVLSNSFRFCTCALFFVTSLPVRSLAFAAAIFHLFTPTACLKI